MGVSGGGSWEDCDWQLGGGDGGGARLAQKARAGAGETHPASIECGRFPWPVRSCCCQWARGALEQKQLRLSTSGPLQRRQETPAPRPSASQQVRAILKVSLQHL